MSSRVKTQGRNWRRQMRWESRSSMKRNCCECSAEAVQEKAVSLNTRHARNERTSPFSKLDFSSCFSSLKTGKSPTFQRATDSSKTHAIAFSTGTSIAKAKGLQSALWKRRTKDYQEQPVGDFNSPVRTDYFRVVGLIVFLFVSIAGA